MLALLLTGCGSAPKLSEPRSPTAGSDVPALPPAGSGRGGYYQDDGPGDSPPVGLSEIPDAIPKVEPYTTRGNRPYVVFGKRYVPITDQRPLKQRGRGSWYGKKFHGQTTSSGEIYDMYKMTAAHPTLPLPSYVRVTNLANGRQVIVRVNDRGPFHSGRIIDLSYTAALKLGYLAAGSAELEVERLLPDEIERLAAARRNAPQESLAQAAAASGAAPDAGSAIAAGVQTQAVPVEAVAVTVLPLEPAPVSAPVSTPAMASAAAPATAQYAGPASAPMAQQAPEGVYLQLGAYSQAANAETARSRLEGGWAAALPPLQVVRSEALYRLYSGPFGSRPEADAALRQLRENGIDHAIVVQK